MIEGIKNDQKMGRDQIMLLPAQELDALVAKNIEGLPVVWGPDPFRVPDRRLTNHHAWINGTVDGQSYDWEPVRRYSTDWNAMKFIIEAMCRHGWRLHLWTKMSPDNASQSSVGYHAEFVSLHDLNGNSHPECQMCGEDAPFAVVRAALFTIEESIKARR
jgi:hypothetical protein